MIIADMKKTLVFLLCCILFSSLQAQMMRDTTLESVLDLSIEQLMNTKVSIATKVDKTVKEAPSIVTVITREMIENTGARHIYDLLMQIPGFEFSIPRAAFYSTGVRGVKDPLTNPRVLLLKDGVPYNGIMYGTGLGMSHMFDMNSIERIEVIRGPGSALYGRNAFSGVVNVITRKAKKKHHAEALVQGGNFNSYLFGASYGTVIAEGGAVLLSFNRVNTSMTDATFDNGKGGESVWSMGADNLHLNAKVHYRGVEFNAYHGMLDLGASVGPFVNNSGKTIDVSIYSLDYSKSLGKGKFNCKTYARLEDQMQNIIVIDKGVTAEVATGVKYSDIYPNGAYATPSYKSYVYGADANLELGIIKQNALMFGVQTDFYGLRNVELYSSYDTYSPKNAPLTYIDNNGSLVFRGKDDQLLEQRGWIEGNGHKYMNLALYVQDIFTPIQGLNFTLGGRYDIDSEIGGVFNPRLAMVWGFHPKLNLKLLYAEAYRAPTANEQYRLTGFTQGNKKP
jgi:iron complex outermembrane receptor protein